MRRVVVTGLGTINGLGNNVNETFTKMINGENGIDFITYFDTTDFKVKLASEIKNLNLEDYLDKGEIRRLDRVTQYGLIAADEAIKDSNLTEFDPYRYGVFFTSGIGGLNTFYEEIEVAVTKGPNRVSPFFVPKTIINMTGGAISIKYGLKGPNIPVVSACAASTNAIGEAFRNIKHGYIDFAITGGAEASINQIGIAGFSAIKALNTTEDKNRASIPFDLERTGFVMGEGAAALVLEEYEHAKKRGAKIYAEIVGYGSTGDAHHMTAPDPEAEAIARAITLAADEAKINLDQIDYINAHGTSTILNDRTETFGIKKAFKDHAYKVNISSTKSMTGHALGAAGALESIAVIKALENNIVPPTINLNVSDPECDLNYTPNVAVKKELNYGLNMNLGFGGHNAVLIFKKGEL
ncbi:beta-ketoacyl-ACP synthase II [Haploplasma modicum]|uniref:beta-ketoacyl-ACP synthase II n=1 Tax=Haploplasma modicum TaxID=2150 RepID=UPI00214C068E|nr:beta-ketoacyl-ACP synthase II [Haploplasma modicum]MCR1809169.1 beta-ketoacyl-ACP synthase II [Haploplasma modicum]